MPVAEFLIGVPASGKSYYTNRMMNMLGDIKNASSTPMELPTVINRDTNRLKILTDNGYDVSTANMWDLWDRERFDHIEKDIYEKQIREALKNKHSNVLFDNLNIGLKKLEALENRFYNAGFETRRTFVTDSQKTCIERDINRQHTVGANVINDTNITMHINYYHELVEKHREFGYGDKKPAVIFDVDGTLAHMNNRSPFDVSDKLLTDTPNVIVTELLRSLYHKDIGNGELQVIILSGRKSMGYVHTMNWLEQNNIPYDELYMRRGWDNRKDSKIKKEIFDNLIEPYYDVNAVFDDRPQVVNMWNDIGLKCIACADQRIKF